MVIEENWAVSEGRAAAFFRSQRDITTDGDVFLYHQCRITLTALEGLAMGKWSIPRTVIHMEGPEEAVRAIHHRFCMQFLSAGG